MSNAGATPLPIPPDAQPPASPVPSDRALKRTKRQSYLARVVLDTLGRASAKLGVTWVMVIVFFAVFAPVLANSHPFALKLLNPDTNQYEWSSPWFENLTPPDVILFVAAGAVGVLYFFKRA